MGMRWYMAKRPSKKSLTLNCKNKPIIANGETNLRGGPIFIKGENYGEFHKLWKRDRERRLLFGRLACDQNRWISEVRFVFLIPAKDKPVNKTGKQTRCARVRTPYTQMGPVHGKTDSTKRKNVFFFKRKNTATIRCPTQPAEIRLATSHLYLWNRKS